MDFNHNYTHPAALILATKKSKKAAKKGGRRKGKRSYKTYIGRVLKGLKGNFRISKKAM
eukprot:gene7584-1498_t